MKRFSMLTRNKFFFLFLLLAAASCSEEEKEPKEIARVGGTILTEDELSSALNDYQYRAKVREEFITNWIEQEVLYQKAVDEGITDDKEYNSIIERSQKELAAALLIKKMLDENIQEPALDDLKNFYEKYKEDFRLQDDTYSYNFAQFNNYEKAIQFRSVLVASDWDKAVNVFRSDVSLLRTIRREFIPGYKLQPVTLRKIMSVLIPNEASIVLETEPMKFTVVQLLEKINKDDIPSFEAAKEAVKERYEASRNKEFIREYIDQLIADHNIEIKRYSE